MNINMLAQYIYANSLPVQEVNAPSATCSEKGTIIVNEHIAIILQDEDKAIVLDIGKKAIRQMQTSTSYTNVVSTVKQLRAQAA